MHPTNIIIIASNWCPLPIFVATSQDNIMRKVSHWALISTSYCTITTQSLPHCECLILGLFHKYSIEQIIFENGCCRGHFHFTHFDILWSSDQLIKIYYPKVIFICRSHSSHSSFISKSRQVQFQEMLYKSDEEVHLDTL